MTRVVHTEISGANASGLEPLSPELVLVDPELAALARARLGSYAPPPQAACAPARNERVPAAVTERLPELDRRRRSRRLLVGVAAAAMLTLLLADVRVEFSERRAAAEPAQGVQAPPERALAPSRETTRTTPKPGTGTESTGAKSTGAKSTGAKSTGAKSTGAKTTGAKSRGAIASTAARRFAWAPVSTATGYHVEFFHGQSRIYARDTTRPQVTVPARWMYEGAVRALRQGEYRWYVWPIVAGQRDTQAAVQATLTIPAAGSN